MSSIYCVWVCAYVCVGIREKRGYGAPYLNPPCTVYGCVRVCVGVGGREPRDMGYPTYVPVTVCGSGWEGDQEDKGDVAELMSL